MYVDVILPLAIEQKFTYFSKIPLKVGDLLQVDFNNKISIALATGIYLQPPSVKFKIKEIAKKLNLPQLEEPFLKFLKWAAAYYMLPLGLVFKSIIFKDLEELKYFRLTAPQAILKAQLNKNKNKIYKKYEKILDLFSRDKLIPFYKLKEQRVRDLSISNMLEANMIVEVSEEEIQTLPIATELLDINHHVKELIAQLNLNAEQAMAKAQMLVHLRTHRVFLLDGITGSGKTACYLSFIIDILNDISLSPKGNGAQALIMLPEILLSSYILSRIKSYFFQENNAERISLDIVEWHSALSKNERNINWHKITDGTAQLIVGARSAIFLPYKNLKIIVIDEEHDSSFKQDSGEFSYNARDLAIVRAKILNIPIILSSATPSLESFHNAKSHKYEYLQLKERFGGAQIPNISLIDMKAVKKVAFLSSNTNNPNNTSNTSDDNYNKLNVLTLVNNIDSINKISENNSEDKHNFNKYNISQYISLELYEALGKNLTLNKQSIIFLNKRGYAPLILCTGCGFRIKCANCSTWMVEHRFKKILLCHLCNATIETPEKCPNCLKEKLISYGPGVEKITQEIEKLFPVARIITLSSDTGTQEKFAAIERNEIDIIVGTQIISKGYDYPNLSLLAVIDADANFHGGDLRSSEKTFQMLQQVIGRVGRRKENIGQVILQTYCKESSLIESLVNQTRDLFYNTELENRKKEFMPPFSKLVSIVISSYFLEEVTNFSKDLARHIKHINTNTNIIDSHKTDIKNNSSEEAKKAYTNNISNNNSNNNFTSEVRVFGPAPAPIEYLNKRYRYRFLIIYKKNYKIQSYIKDWLSYVKINKKIKLQIDIDPINFL